MKALFFLSILIGSFLLFLIQPMLAKILLPIVGGAPAVWIVSMLFFQMLLLGGYGYAALGSALMSPKMQLLLHIALFALAALLYIPLQLHLPNAFDANHPEGWILLALLLTIGLPYFLLSSNATLIQRWYHARYQTSPYFLFSLSNIGSFAGLLGYPFLLEWMMPVAAQMKLWSSIFVLLLPALMGIFVALSRVPFDHKKDIIGKNLRWKQAAYIVLLGFIPSSLFLSTTLYATTNIASFPLIWVIPLGLYLLSFVIVFGPQGERLFEHAQKWHFVAIILMVGTMFIPGRNSLILMLQLALVFIAFFIVALSAHGRAAMQKPQATRLTAYFFWLSLGGALGGLFNTLAPYLFHFIAEQYLVLLLSTAALPANHFKLRPLRLPLINIEMTSAVRLMVTLILLCIATGYLFVLIQSDEKVLLRERSFFGLSKVHYNPEKTMLQFAHGNTYHGFQPTDPEHKLHMTAYYSPIKRLVDRLPERFFSRPFAMVGMGIGIVACYGKKGQRIDFFEIDPLVIKIASDTRLFTYLRDCPPDIRTVLGDGRLKLAEQVKGQYNLLLMDAFTSDAVPMHLLTQEALGMFIEKINPEEGFIAYHVSNRYLQLQYLLKRLADSYGWKSYYRSFEQDPENAYTAPSKWVILTPPNSPWLPEIEVAGFELITEDVNKGPLWTDDYSNILSVIDY